MLRTERNMLDTNLLQAAKKLVKFNTYILLDVLLSSFAEYFYELFILTRPTGSLKYKQRIKILSDTTQENV